MSIVRTGGYREERFGFSESGKLYLQWKKEGAKLAGIIISSALITTTLGLLFYNHVFFAWGAVIAGFFGGVGAARVFLKGQKYCYEADEKEMSLYIMKAGDRKLLSDTFYYSDIMEVSCKPWQGKRGLAVTVRTKYRIIKYFYIFNGSERVRDLSATPFHILEQRKSAENPTDTAK